MLDFITISTRSPKRGIIEIYPKFIVKKSSDLMIRGGDFYAIWIEERGLWSTEEYDAIQLIDYELDKFAEEHRSTFGDDFKVLHLRDAETGMIDRWHKYCQRDMPDIFHMLDEKIIFSNSGINKKDYASKRLSYPLEAGKHDAYDKLMSTLYSPEERHKIEWAIGSIVHGDSKEIQKFVVLYGAAGTGKSTILNIIQQLFDGYYAVFDAKALGQSSNTFALEPFKSNPLVAIQHDGDLSHIEDNTRLNSLVSHEMMTVNEKFKSAYTNQFKAFLFMGTNRPVKITDAKSGLLRRLIDISPTGNKLGPKEYRTLCKQIKFELGAIAKHCEDVYLSNPGIYDNYIPLSMMGASNDFYNFVIDSYYELSKNEGITLKKAYKLYNEYCEEAKVPYPLTRMVFKEELKNYFTDYNERFSTEDQGRVRSYYSGFKKDIFTSKNEENKQEAETGWLKFEEIPSLFDTECSEYPAQYATDDGIPSKKWENITTKLSKIDTKRLHYVKVPENHIVIDFDIPDANGNKSFERNLEAANKWPKTYAELSKSGAGIHLHYIYSGDPSKLSRIYEEHVEIKVFNGKSSLRRKLSKCNDIPIATISSGLPLKGEKVVNLECVKSEKGLRTLIMRNLNKEIHPGTKPSVDFIYKILEDAYASDLVYDVTDMRNAVLAFAASSTHQSDYCIKLVNKMQFKSDSSKAVDNIGNDVKKPLVFFDIEVFPNLFLVCWKIQGEGKPVVRMFNPSPEEIEELVKLRLVGYNCRRYDNHILYARMQGYNNLQLYNLSRSIISKKRDAFFSNAYGISETDIFDFASSGNKKSLKKLEIEMGINHQELGMKWDEPVPEELWIKVAEYCDNDVIATEAAFNYLSADWTARQILADLTGMTVNDTTNQLTTRLIFGKNREPQNEFHYRNLAEPVFELDEESLTFLKEACPDMMAVRHGEAGSLLPYFPGYEVINGKSYYRGEEVGEGGYVYSEPGMYGDVALLDISSMHPHSAIAEILFGPRFTRAFRQIVEARVSIKHEAWNELNDILDGKLTPYIQKVINGELTSKSLADALKTAINSVYGLTAAKFKNSFKDDRNIDNIVAKRGALFMIDLKHEVQKRGFIVAHIKTDSIKIPDATPEIIEFVMEFGKKYGYSFEHEATYERMCLVNKSTYIAKYRDGKKAGQWTATGDQFKVPYVFKSLFSKEPITFDDMCETFSVDKGDLYLDFCDGLPDVSEFEFIRDARDKAKENKKLTKKEELAIEMNQGLSDIDIQNEIDKGHKLRFVGRVGQFCPIKPGCGGGILYRVADGKNYAASGTTGYYWIESEIIRGTEKENDINKEYYRELVDEAIKDINVQGDFEWFVSDAPYVGPEFVPGEEMSYPVYQEGLPWN